MGNSLRLPCLCHRCCHGEVNELEAGTAVAGAKKRRRRTKQLLQKPAADCSRNVAIAARPRHVVVPVVDDDAPPEDGDGGRDRQEREAWPECRVEPAGHGDDDDSTVRVRIVMKRKDIAQLVARLEQRGEEVVVTELAGCNSGNDGGGGGGGGTMVSPCRDAWRPRLSIIPENY